MSLQNCFSIVVMNALGKSFVFVQLAKKYFQMSIVFGFDKRWFVVLECNTQRQNLGFVLKQSINYSVGMEQAINY